MRCQQKTINGDPPALLQGLNGAGRPMGGMNQSDDEVGVFYDELISYPPQFRAPNHPPAYEVIIFLNLEHTSHYFPYHFSS